MRNRLPIAIVALLSLIVIACSSAGASPSASPAASAAAPSVAASPSTAEVSASPTPDACAVANLKLTTPGTLTIGTDNPAYPPFYDLSDPAVKPWELGDPTNGRGFESAFAYALAAKLGFAKDKVAWTYVPFNNSYAPGPKPFDIDVNQVSYNPERAKSADLSDGYYFVNQAVVAVKGTPAAAAKTIADLKGVKFGAQVGTTSYDTITKTVAPTTETALYDTNDAAITALGNGQIDALVVDLPTAFQIVGAEQVKNGVIVGQFANAAGADPEHFSVVLDKDSALTACVNAGIAALKADGSLDAITKEWLSDKASAPLLAP